MSPIVAKCGYVFSASYVHVKKNEGWTIATLKQCGPCEIMGNLATVGALLIPCIVDYVCGKEAVQGNFNFILFFPI